MTLSFQRFLEAAGGRFVADSAAMPKDFRPSTDSRTIEPGESFVCLRGPNFDGHDFISNALARGARAVVVDDEAKVPRATAAAPIVRVADTKAAYLAGAKAARKVFSGQFIAVTGSNGKTTTKEFAAQIVGSRRRVIATPLNENNELGVAKLCYRLEDEDVAIAEFGARHPGEIAQLVELAAPDIGVLTNVGEAHLEFFDDQAELARTKYALFSEGARPVCNAADTWSRMLAAESRKDASTLWVRLVGDPAPAGIMLEAGAPRDGTVAVTFGASHAFATWLLPGDHNLRDALLAAGAALQAGVSFEESVAAFGELQLPPGRFETHEIPGGPTIVYDAYNASPASMLHALRTFAQMPASRHIAVLGSMAELGADASLHHTAVGEEAARSGLDALYCGGPFAEQLAAGARDAGMPADAVSTFDSNGEISDRLRRTTRSGDCVLLKGSRVQRMEEILHGLLPPGILAL